MKDDFVTHTLVIKNMICTRCLKVVRQHLEAAGVEILGLELGQATIRFPRGQDVLPAIEAALQQDDFELLKDREEQLVEQIKLDLRAIINRLPVPSNLKLSDYLSGDLGRSYSLISRAFSKSQGMTIERYFILLRIEKAKELLEYGEMNFSEIAHNLGYKYVNHLSGQFRQVSGLSMTEYRKLKDHRGRRPINKIV